MYISASPERTRQAVTIERLATTPLVFYDTESGNKDPIRRQLVERAQALGLRLQPKVEVELKDIRLVAGGVGDTYLPSAYTHASYYPTGLYTASFEPVVHDTFAVVTRTGRRLSPGVQKFLTSLEGHLHAVAAEFDVRGDP
ncbi:MAG: LysR substrate-binding domain-containing protein [Actinomycetota bacterium]